MRGVLGMAAVMLATAALATSAAADSVQYQNGVTVLRGTGGDGATNGAAAVAGTGSSAPSPSNNFVADQSGKLNARHTGSENAGGTIPNPPPGAGR